jgi:hypothetical protein
MADLLDAAKPGPDALPPGQKLRLLSTLYGRNGMAIGCLAERESDRAYGLCRRIGPDGAQFEQVAPFLTLTQLQGLALQVAAENPNAVAHPATPLALATGVLALLAAIGAGFSQPEDVHVQVPQAT